MQKNLMIGISVIAVFVVVCALFSSVAGGTIVIPSTGQQINKSSSALKGHWLYVGGSGPGNYTTIQDAINASSDGDTVYVFQGSYYGKVVINKSISLLGEDTNRTFINYTYEPNWYSQVILMRSHDVVFSGFTAVLEQGDGALLRLKDSPNCTISHNIFRCKEGIDLLNSSYTSIENNTFFCGMKTISSYGIIKHNWFTNNGLSGVNLLVYANENVISDNYFYHCYANAILSYSPYRNIIERNVIRQNISSEKDGITIFLEYSEYFPPGNIIRENDIAGCGIGIDLKGDYFTIDHNIVHDNDWGIEFTTFSFNHVSVNNNIFLNDYNGIDISYGKYDSTVERNIFQGCRWALSLYQCSGLTIQFNNFTNNTCAVEPWQSNLNTISQNNFIGNHHYVFSCLSRNIWSGNYWGEPRSLPKLILGILPFIQFDWHPAKQPN